jgi:branched-chain amino acid aminotransferase
LLWTDAFEHRYIEESGTMNVMFQLGERLVTPPTGDTILKGITRDSVIKLGRSLGITVDEYRVSIDEIEEAYNKGELLDAFGIGTAATIAPIELIGYKGRNMLLPPVGERKLSELLRNELAAIRYGRVEDKFGWMVSMNP